MSQFFTDIIGYAAACLTTLAFLPQVIKTVKHKKTEGISLVMYVLFCTGVFAWLVYGLVLMSAPLIIANGLTFTLAMIILFFKLKFG